MDSTCFGGKVLPLTKKGLSSYIGPAKGIAEPVVVGPLGPGDKFWSTAAHKPGDSSRVAQRPVVALTVPRTTPRGILPQASDGYAMKVDPSLLSDSRSYSDDSSMKAQAPYAPRLPDASFSRAPPGKAAAASLMQWVEKEIQVQSKWGPVTPHDRVRVYSEAFGRAMDLLPDYRPLLLKIQNEYESLIQVLQGDLQNLASLQSRMKAIKMESLAFVGESTLKFKEELSQVRSSLSDTEKERDELRQVKAKLEEQCEHLRFKSERDKFLANEAHAQNLDIVGNLERMEKQVETHRKQEREIHLESAKLIQRVKEKDFRIQTVEEQLKNEQDKVATMVGKDDHEAVKEEVRKLKISCRDLEERVATKDKEYWSLRETYTQQSGQTLGQVFRPVTPRPRWHHCKGVLDPDDLRSDDKAESLQEIVQNILSTSRTFLAAYGLASASQKSKVFQEFARHPLTLPLAEEDLPATERLVDAPAEEDVPKPSGSEQALSQGPESSTDDAKEDGILLNPDDLHPGFIKWRSTHQRQSEKVRDLQFSRKKTSEFIEKIMNKRSLEGDKLLKRPFLDVMMENILQDCIPGEALTFAGNIFASLRRYAAEPDFLCYLLLILGRISDSIVRDNKGLCSEILKIFISGLKEIDGSTRLTNRQMANNLKEVLPYCKEKDLILYLPTSLIHYESLLQDDPYVLSPIVYFLRLQHLEASLDLCDRIDQTLKRLSPSQTEISYEALEAACKKVPELVKLENEDFARVFEKTPDKLRGCSQEVGCVLELLKHSSIFRKLFPAVHDDEDDPDDGHEEVDAEDEGDTP